MVRLLILILLPLGVFAQKKTMPIDVYGKTFTMEIVRNDTGVTYTLKDGNKKIKSKGVSLPKQDADDIMNSKIDNKDALRTINKQKTKKVKQ